MFENKIVRLALASSLMFGTGVALTEVGSHLISETQNANGNFQSSEIENTLEAYNQMGAFGNTTEVARALNLAEQVLNEKIKLAPYEKYLSIEIDFESSNMSNPGIRDNEFLIIFGQDEQGLKKYKLLMPQNQDLTDYMTLLNEEDSNFLQEISIKENNFNESQITSIPPVSIDTSKVEAKQVIQEEYDEYWNAMDLSKEDMQKLIKVLSTINSNINKSEPVKTSVPTGIYPLYTSYNLSYFPLKVDEQSEIASMIDNSKILKAVGLKSKNTYWKGFREFSFMGSINDPSTLTAVRFESWTLTGTVANIAEKKWMYIGAISKNKDRLDFDGFDELRSQINQVDISKQINDLNSQIKKLKPANPYLVEG